MLMHGKHTGLGMMLTVLNADSTHAHRIYWPTEQRISVEHDIKFVQPAAAVPALPSSAPLPIPPAPPDSPQPMPNSTDSTMQAQPSQSQTMC